jgi:hypothetical protein
MQLERMEASNLLLSRSGDEGSGGEGSGGEGSDSESIPRVDKGKYF